MHILWDLDGTIFDTYPTILRAFKEATGIKAPDDEVLQELKKTAHHAFTYFGMDRNKEWREAEQNFHELEGRIPPEEKPLFPYVEQALQKADINVIVTHKARKSAEDIMDFHGIRHLFTEIITKDDGYKRKPNPESYRYLHEKYHIDLAVGDRELDLLPAKELNIKTCAFQNRQIEADYYLDHYEKFDSIIK